MLLLLLLLVLDINITEVTTHPCLTPTQSRGYSSSGVMIISNTFKGDVQAT